MTNKPKLSILTIDFGAGGTERVISLLLPKLINDFEVTLVIFYDYVDYAIPEDVKLVILKPETRKISSFLFKIKNFTTLFFKYKKLIKTEGIEVSLSLLPIPNIINSFISIGNNKVKTIISERCYPSIMYRENRLSLVLAKVFFPILYNRNDALFSNSIHINKDLKTNFGLKLPLKVIYNPIEINKELKIDHNIISFKKTLKIINVGTIYSAKNQKLIIEAMNTLTPGDIYLSILGDGPLMEELKMQIEELNLNHHVSLNGKVKNVKDHLVKSDCFVLTSNTEGFPNVLLEALSIGLPSISTNCLSGPLEMLNDNNPVNIAKGEFYKAKFGLLINVGDAEALRKALNYFRNDPRARQHYSKMAFERAKDYNLPKIYEQVKDLLTF